MVRHELKEARINKKLTQSQMAEKLSVSRSTYSNYENGIRTPSIEKIILIKKILNIKNDNFFLKK